MSAPHFVPSITVIDSAETAVAARDLAALARKLDPDSPAAAVVEQARREIASLLQAAEAPARPRLRVAA